MKNRLKHQKRNIQNQESIASNQLWLFGKHPVFTALQQKRRKFFKILVTKNFLPELEDFSSKHKLNSFKHLIEIVDNQKIETLAGKDQTHQGIIALCSKLPIKNQEDLLEELQAITDQKLPTLLLLDQISDPHNVGAIIRSASAFGIKKIIFPDHNSVKENSTIIKSSAGTIEFVDLISVINFSQLMERLKKIGYWCIGLDGSATANINEIKDYKNIALVIGSEGNGIRPLVKKNCDLLAKINLDEKVESLNASVAAGIVFYELCKTN